MWMFASMARISSSGRLFWEKVVGTKRHSRIKRHCFCQCRGSVGYFPRLVLLAGFGPFVRLRLLPPCWNCGTREFLWLSATKSICDSEGTLNENFVIPSKLVTAKSPPAMMSMPIKISAPGKLPLVTRTPLAPTELGRIMLTRYVSDSPCPSTE